MADDDLIRGPKWRTRTEPGRRARAATATAFAIALLGAGLMALAMWALDTSGAPGWLVTLPWWLPTLGVALWTLRNPAPAKATDDDDDSWALYAIRFVLVGADVARPAPIRVVAALVLGAPLAWALLLVGALIVVGAL